MLRTFETEEETYRKFKEICNREGSKMGDKLNEFIKEYIKVHGEGNPIHAIEKWADPDFRSFPAFGEKMSYWTSYLSKCKPEEAEEIMNKADSIRDMARNYS